PRQKRRELIDFGSHENQPFGRIALLELEQTGHCMRIERVAAEAPDALGRIGNKAAAVEGESGAPKVKAVDHGVAAIKTWGANLINRWRRRKHRRADSCRPGLRAGPAA